jgi:intermembrane space import and assembly protein 40
MQDCFRLYPEIYGSEIDEDEMDEQLDEQRAALESSAPASEGGEQQSTPVVNREAAKEEPKSESTSQAPEENKETK